LNWLLRDAKLAAGLPVDWEKVMLKMFGKAQAAEMILLGR